MKNNSISKINEWKMTLGKVDPPRHDWKPLKSWPAVPHDRQAEMDSFLRAPSAYS